MLSLLLNDKLCDPGDFVWRLHLRRWLDSELCDWLSSWAFREMSGGMCKSSGSTLISSLSYPTNATGVNNAKWTLTRPRTGTSDGPNTCSICPLRRKLCIICFITEGKNSIILLTGCLVVLCIPTSYSTCLLNVWQNDFFFI